MENSVWKLMGKLAVVLLPLLLCSSLVCLFPMKFLDDEYGLYRQNQDYVKENIDDCRVLIMGDSGAKDSWLPAKLSPDTYNLGLGGGIAD